MMAEMTVERPVDAATTAAGDGRRTTDEALRCEGLSVAYGEKQALAPCDMTFAPSTVTALIGPSGCGKSTFLRCLNLMNREIANCHVGGHIWFHGQDALAPGCDVYDLRRRIGMVFQQPNPFPLSIYDNVAYGPRRHRRLSRAQLDEIVERSLRRVGLFDEVKDELKKSGLALSGGQQQRLCIARTLAVDPEVLLMDEPTSALDPISTKMVEGLMRDLARDHTVIVVTHNMQQAERVSNRTAFFYLGELVDVGPTKELFSHPRERRTQDYLSGRFS